MQPLYWTPKRIKELKAAGYKLHASPASLVKKSDQTISASGSCGLTKRVRSGPGQRPQASSSKHQASSAKLIKQQAASIKPGS